jgi:RNA polymerase sigma-70 factor (ECF subfamily)
VPVYTEEELLQRAKAGERSAFDLLRKKLEGRVRHFVQRLVGQSDSEEDIVQDAFIALYMNLGRIDPPAHLRPFLFRVVRNRCYDELRRKGRFQWVSLDGDGGESEALLSHLADRAPRPDEVVQWHFLLSQVQEAIDRLPELQRQTLILLCEEGLSYAQVAEAMATDIGTVKSRVHYGRKALMRQLGPGIVDALGLRKEIKNDRHDRAADRTSSR